MKLLILFLAAAAFLQPQSYSSNSQPQVIYKTDPQYTPEALQARVSGVVTLRTVITEEGQASEITVIRGLGYGLDEKAVQCLQQWRFKPGARNFQPVAVRATVEINFRLPPQ